MNNVLEMARSSALLTLQEFTTQPTSLISYQSNGRVIIIGDAAALDCCSSFSSPLVPVLVCSSDTVTSAKEVINLDNRTVQVKGHLGQFEVSLSDGQGVKENLQADLILDLSSFALVRHEVPPAGYFHRSVNLENARQIYDELVAMTGEFEKPKYFNYNANICAHGVNGATFCTLCIDACPAGAISSLVEKIEVDSYLCQGGGTCATVCPSGAIQYVYPRLTDNGNRIRKMLQTYRQQGGETACVMFHTEDEVPAEFLEQHPGLLPVKVEELASAGMDLCLSTLVYGASQIIYLANGAVPELSLEKLRQQLDWLSAILIGLEIDPAVVSVQYPQDSIVSVESSVNIEPAIYSMPDIKRHAIYQALDHLYQQGMKSRELIELPPGAPFGTATINQNTCTLCMACVGACPGKALQDGSGREIPEIFFIESHCIQCGVCVQTCPEQAISISPRFIFDREKRNRTRALNQDTPFACISCGKPFAPTSVINKMNEKLKDHYMFQTDRALDRLKMCEDCRVVDIVQDPAALNGNFDPLN